MILAISTVAILSTAPPDITQNHTSRARCVLAMGVAMAAITITSADAADNGRHAHQLEQPRRAAAVNGLLNGLVQTIPRRRAAANRQAKRQQEQAAAAPMLDSGAIGRRPADITQQGKDHQRSNRCHGIFKIELHHSSFFLYSPSSLAIKRSICASNMGATAD